MSPERMDGRAYRAVGGAVLTRSGRDVSADVAGLLRFYGRLAVERRLLGDRAVATHLARVALELATATQAADDWRRAAAGLECSAFGAKGSEPSRGA